MITKKYPYGHSYKDEFESLFRIGKGEGYSTYTAKKDGKFFVIDDCGTLADILEEHESRELISIHQFQNLKERVKYLLNNEKLGDPEMKDILKYQQDCFKNYNLSINLIPTSYIYPTGNPIRPLPPLQTNKNGIMIVGAYPSARFEQYESQERKGIRRLIPVGNNLHPFADEEYFDGTAPRVLESGKGLRKYILTPMGLNPDDLWITDLVKVFLYKKDHQDAINEIFAKFNVPVLRDEFDKIGEKSLPWLKREIEICNPKLIITLGHEVAQIIHGKKVEAKKLLANKVHNPKNVNGIDTIYAPHPDICRRNDNWESVMEAQLELIKNYVI